MGRYQGHSVAEIATQFEACLRDPSMRSVTAILRITREQLDARGALGSYPYIAAGLTAISIGVLLADFTIPGFADHARMLTIGVPSVALMVWAGVWHARHERRSGLAQEREIRRMAADALAKVLEHDFRRKPLEREHILALQDLIKRESRPGFEELLRES